MLDRAIEAEKKVEELKKELSVVQEQLALAYAREPISESEYGVHVAHCCQVHGCKYGGEEDDHLCPVVAGKIKREENAGWCQEPGLVDDPKVCRLPGERMPADHEGS